MRKAISWILMVVLCFSVVFAASAETVNFVPSISYKPAPEIVDVLPGEHRDCLLVTPVSKVEETPELPEEAKKELKDVYALLSQEGVKLSVICPTLNDMVKEVLGENRDADDLVLRDLFDLTLLCGDMVISETTPLTVTFATTVKKDEPVFVMTYVNGTWDPVKTVVNNGDGTITCTFTELCPVAFMVPASIGSDDTQTGDIAASDALVWVALMLTALVAMVLLLVVYRRRTGKDAQ